MYGEMKSFSCHFVSMAMLMRDGGGGKGGGLAAAPPPSQSRAFEQFIKLLKSIQAGGRFNKSLPLSPSDERRGEGGCVCRERVGRGREGEKVGDSDVEE